MRFSGHVAPMRRRSHPYGRTENSVVGYLPESAGKRQEADQRAENAYEETLDMAGGSYIIRDIICLGLSDKMSK